MKLSHSAEPCSPPEEPCFLDPLLSGESVSCTLMPLLSTRPVSKGLVLGSWGSILVHLIVIALMLAWPHIYPREVSRDEVITVSLVSFSGTGTGLEGSEDPGRSGEASLPLQETQIEASAPAEPEKRVELTPPPPVKEPEREPVPPIPQPQPKALDLPREQPKPVVTKPEKPKQQKPKPVEKAKAAQSESSAKPNASIAPSDTPCQTGSGSGVGSEEGSGSGYAGIGGKKDSPGGIGDNPRAEYQINQVDKPPVVVNRVEPDYPFMARRQCLSGKIVVKFLVDPNGSVKRASIVNATPAGVFDKCVLEAIGKWRFKPGYYRGQPVSTWVVVPIQFKLSG